jgi:exopolysaccharide biosynthesis polyprenyl glycosylphosphotransferase
VVRVFNHWVSPRKAVYFLAEEAVLVVALLAGAALGPVAATTGGAAGAPVAPAVTRAALASLFFAGALYLGDLYDVHAAVRDRADGRRLLRALGVATIALALADVALAAVLPGWLLHRSLVLAATGGALGVLAARALMPAVVGSPTRVLFLGAGTRARDLARAVEREADGLWEVVGFALPPGAAPGTAAVPEHLVHSGPVDELVRQVRAQVVVVALEDRRERLPLEALLALRTRGGRVVDDVSFAEAALQRIPLSLVRPSTLIFEEGFRVSRVTRLAKRTVDLLGAATLLVLLAPAMALVSLVVLVVDGRPVLYTQERTGQGGRTYRIRKFRTMRRDAEQRGAAWATESDPRVIPVGRFLRRARLDELPQLWNVLRGDMSLVGPRPEREVFLRELEARYPLFRLRELAKPGLSGWAQLKYGYGSTVEEQGRKLEYDLYYIKNTSLFLDLVCLLATAKVVLLGRGAR